MHAKGRSLKRVIDTFLLFSTCYSCHLLPSLPPWPQDKKSQQNKKNPPRKEKNQNIHGKAKGWELLIEDFNGSVLDWQLLIPFQKTFNPRPCLQALRRIVPIGAQTSGPIAKLYQVPLATVPHFRMQMYTNSSCTMNSSKVLQYNCVWQRNTSSNKYV